MLWLGAVDAISARFGSGATLPASSRHSSSGSVQPPAGQRSRARRRGRRSPTAAPGRSGAAASTPSRRRSGTASRARRAAGRRVISHDREPSAATRANRYARSSAWAVASIEDARAVGLRLERAHRVVRGVRALELARSSLRPAGQLGDRLVQLARSLAVGPADDRVDRRRRCGRPRTAAAPAAARRRSPRSRRPRRRAGRARRPPPAATRPRARRPRSARRAAATTCARRPRTARTGRTRTPASPSAARRQRGTRAGRS